MYLWINEQAISYEYHVHDWRLNVEILKLCSILRKEISSMEERNRSNYNKKGKTSIMFYWMKQIAKKWQTRGNVNREDKTIFESHLDNNLQKNKWCIVVYICITLNQQTNRFSTFRFSSQEYLRRFSSHKHFLEETTTHPSGYRRKKGRKDLDERPKNNQQLGS